MDRNLKVGIVGLGLIGGSIFKALCALKCNVYATSKSNYTIEKAKKYCENVSKSLLHLRNCDVIFVCTHMNKTLEVLDKLDGILPPSAIVADVCSLKRFLSHKKFHYKFIPTHPMAGTEFVGFENSFETLFQDAKWILTPFENTDKADIKKVAEIIEVLGATPIFSTPKEHDEAVALISHMPMLVAQAMFKTAQDNSLALKLASSGFRDMTRLAISNEEMALDMINLNSDNIQNAILKLYSSVGELLNRDYQTQIKEIKKERQIMYVDGKNVL
ncbi:MAG: prephenate dehydrogenase/arogenate dehydrogenase family protein [Candidatus Gastranaerophilaceae bacterium]